MRTMISVTGSLSMLVLSWGPALAADPTTTTPPAQPSAGLPAEPTVTPADMPPAPTASPPIATTPPSAEPAPLPPPAPPVAAAPGPYSPSVADRDAANHQFVERGFGRELPASVVGAGLILGGGVQDFSGANARNVTNTGGYWNVRLVAGTREYIGLEGAYIGSAQAINALGLSSNATLVSNGVEGVVRLNAPIVRRALLVEPFVFGGAGWSRFHVASSPVNTSDIATDDDIMAVPYGAGLTLAYRGLMADARFTYRSTFYNDMLRAAGGSLDNWSAGAQLGFEF
jgi:hypothetical protein